MLNYLNNLVHRMAASVAERRNLRRAYAELSALDDRSLADIGISRSEIAYVLTHNPRPRAPVALGAPASSGELRHAV
jgi:uncharacterized protein YjiS (DUF1127 family)